jgi:hypothetical protein
MFRNCDGNIKGILKFNFCQRKMGAKLSSEVALDGEFAALYATATFGVRNRRYNRKYSSTIRRAVNRSRARL